MFWVSATQCTAGNSVWPLKITGMLKQDMGETHAISKTKTTTTTESSIIEETHTVLITDTVKVNQSLKISDYLTFL